MTTIKGTKGADTVAGTPDGDFIEGGKGADILRGSGGNDVIKGGKGADTLTGGEGVDALKGGGGKDTFVLQAASDVDTILDYKAGVDTVLIMDSALSPAPGDWPQPASIDYDEGLVYYDARPIAVIGSVIVSPDDFLLTAVP